MTIFKGLFSQLFLYLTLIVVFQSCSHLTSQKRAHVKLLHYNIFELDTEKLLNEDHPQFQAVKKLLADEDFNVFSINELQFDLPGIPGPTMKTTGQNLKTLLQRIKPHKEWDLSFYQAHTGKLARKFKNRYMTPSQKKANLYADPVNYGLYPGQYSTGLGTTYRIVERKIISDLPWKTFNPKINLKKYRDSSQRRLPKHITLFDKNFVDTTVEIEGRRVHLITLHAVPAYHIGNKQSPNRERNADQLRFLEWYLTGKTDRKIELPPEFQHITPLSSDTPYVAMGDWNTDINKKSQPGSIILKRMAQANRLFPTEESTFEEPGYHPNRLKMTLDYIFYSEHFELLEAKVLHAPERRLFLGCGGESLPHQQDPTRVEMTFKRGKNLCSISVDQHFATAKTASDHFPIYAKLHLR